MYTSIRRINVTPTVRVDATAVRLDITGEDAVIDMGDNPAYHPPAQVIALEISYKTTHTYNGDAFTLTSEVTAITYRITGKDYDSASVHPDFLDQPDQWPDWVRELVDEYNPAN